MTANKYSHELAQLLRSARWCIRRPPPIVMCSCMKGPVGWWHKDLQEVETARLCRLSLSPVLLSGASKPIAQLRQWHWQ